MVLPPTAEFAAQQNSLARTPLYRVKLTEPSVDLPIPSAYWKLDEVGGNRNSSYGNYQLADHNTVASVAGVQGNAALFVRANQEWLSYTPTAGDIFNVGTNPFFFSCWIKMNSISNFMTVAGQWGDNAHRTWRVAYNPSQSGLEFTISNNTNSLQTTLTIGATELGSAPAVGQKYFLCAWYDPSADRVYFQVNNGTVKSIAPGLVPNSDTEDFRVGADRATAVAVDWFDGYIDEVYYSRTLPSADDRTKLYNNGVGVTLPFVARTLVYATAVDVSQEFPEGLAPLLILEPIELLRKIELADCRFPISTFTFRLHDPGGSATLVGDISTDVIGWTCQFDMWFWDLPWSTSSHVPLFGGIIADVPTLDNGVYTFVAHSYIAAAQNKVIFNGAQTRLRSSVNSVLTQWPVEDTTAFESADYSELGHRFVLCDKELVVYRGKTQTSTTDGKPEINGLQRSPTYPLIIPPVNPDGQAASHSQFSAVRECVALGQIESFNYDGGSVQDLHPMDHLRTVCTSSRTKVAVGRQSAIILDDIQIASLRSALGSGLQFLFMDSEPVNAKDFLDKEFFLATASVPLEHADGRIGGMLLKSAGAFSQVAALDDSHLLTTPRWARNADALVNMVIFKYDYMPTASSDRYTSSKVIRDDTLIKKHGRELPKVIESKGIRSLFRLSDLFGDLSYTQTWGAATEAFLEAAGRRYISRFGFRANILSTTTTLQSGLLLELCDDILGNFSNVIDEDGGDSNIVNGKFQLTTQRMDFTTNTVDLELTEYSDFQSTASAGVG